jgi:YD repeat-containing protein
MARSLRLRHFGSFRQFSSEWRGPAATTQTLVYGYDALYRLTSASGGPAGSTSYTYDPVGNRLTRTRGGVATTYAYDARGLSRVLQATDNHGQQYDRVRPGRRTVRLVEEYGKREVGFHVI